jgi:site-specific recombinase XerD
MLLVFAQERIGKAPYGLDVADMDSTLISAFLAHLEKDRHNSVATRNARLAAIHSLFRYAALHHPEHAEVIQRVLAIPTKRHDRDEVCYLDPDEIDALLAAPDKETWVRRRDHTLLVLTVQTGLRVSELIGLRCIDVQLGTGAHVKCRGKGRKQRATPLTGRTAAVLRVWMNERAGQPTHPLFPSLRGGPLSTDAVEWLVAKYSLSAVPRCSSLAAKHPTPHTLRHSCAMNLLTAGSTSPSSPSGSKAAKRRRPTFTPTWHSRRKRWLEPNHQTPRRDDIDHRTPCSPS